MVRSVGAVLLAGSTVAWLYAGTLQWRSAMVLEQAMSRPVTALSTDDPPRFDPNVALYGARQLSARGDGDRQIALALLEHSLRARPLYAPAWADYADLLLRQGRRAEAGRAAEHAVSLWPERHRLVWRVALLQMRLGNTPAALDTLARYWRLVPARGPMTLGFARRLEPDTDAFLARMLPAHLSVNDTLARQLLDFARQRAEPDLARALWARLDADLRASRRLLLAYIDYLRAIDADHEARAVWSEVFGDPALVHNGGFERPLFDAGFGWRAGEPAGVSIRRVRGGAYEGAYSLLIEFDGEHNVNFSHLRQTLILEPGRTYRLSGYWRASEITTRSGVFVELYDAGQRSNRVRTEARFGSWDWERFTLDITPTTPHLELRLRRRSVQALDRLIGGRLWLDDVRMQPLDTRGHAG